MIYNLIITILTSSVISSLIAVISNILLNQKNNSLEYITSERTAWRQEIREIAEEIEKADESNINIPLTKLKVRINAYDYFEQNQQDLGDYDLWKFINMLEEASSERYKLIKNNLIMLISLMLKYDWERSKKEVKINKTSLLMHFCAIIQIIVYLLLSLIFNFRFIESVSFALWYTIILLVVNILIDYKPFNRKNKLDKYKKNICFLFFGMVYGSAIGAFYNKNLIFDGESITNAFQRLLLGSIVILPTGFWLFFSVKRNTLEKYRYDYVKSLKSLQMSMDKTVKSMYQK